MNPAQTNGTPNDNWERLLGFVEEELGESLNLGPDTDLREDLGLWGEDAYEFLENFIAEFNLEVGNFIFSDYFEREGIDFSELLFWKKRREKKRLTLQDLYLAMDNGSLA